MSEQMNNENKQQLKNSSVGELMGPKLTTDRQRNRDATAAMTAICKLHRACSSKVELGLEAIVALVEF